MGRRRAGEKMGRGKDWEGEEEEIRGRKYWKGKEVLGGGGGREKGEKDKGRGERR